MFGRRSATLISPVLVIDALGFSAEIRCAGREALAELVSRLDDQYHQFRAKVPHRIMMVGRKRVWGTREFATLRLNDMFVLHAGQEMVDPALRFGLCASLLYHSMMLAGLIPRGGLGYGPIHRSGDALLGSAFLEAYEAAEKRAPDTRNICAVQLAPSFALAMPNTERAWRLMCFYRGCFFVHPWFLIDPQMGEFSPARILDLLSAAGANADKLVATETFLRELEDYDAAKLPGSGTRLLLEEAGAPWKPRT